MFKKILTYFCLVLIFITAVYPCKVGAALSWNVRAKTAWKSVASSADGLKLAILGSDASDAMGYIYTSSDGGDTWTERVNAGRRQWSQISSSADGSKLAVTSGYDIYTSSNSGVTWVLHENVCLDICIPIASSADGTKLATAGWDYGHVYTSSDSGATWTMQEGSGGSTWNLLAMSADGTKLAVADQEGSYIKTSSDGGVTWTPQTGSGRFRDWNSLSMSADGTKLVAAYGPSNNMSFVYTSTDSGVTWTPQSSFDGSSLWRSARFSADGTKLIAVDEGGYIWTSDNGGASATLQTGSGARNWDSVVASADGSRLLAYDKDGHVFSSFDGGIIWSMKINTGAHLWRVITSSADGTKLAAATSGGHIFTSTNNGTWFEQVSSINQDWMSITSSADGTKLAATHGDLGYIYTSSDGGVTWIQRTSAGEHFWGTITSSADGAKLAAVITDDEGGPIYTSSDSGATWTPQANSIVHNSSGWQSIVSSVDGVKLVASAAMNGYIYTSSDSGVTWTEQTNAGQRNWRSLTSSADGTKLAAMVPGDYIYTSSDSGVTWTPQVSSGQREWMGSHINRQAITSSADGTKLGAVDSDSSNSTNYIYISVDGGVTWLPQTVAGQHDWTSITSSINGFTAVANNGYIYSSTFYPNIRTYSYAKNTPTSVTFEAVIDATGTSDIIANGFQYGLDTNYGFSSSADASNTNTFASTITTLNRNTTYHFRAYSTNQLGTGYGADSKVTTDFLTSSQTTPNHSGVVVSSSSTPQVVIVNPSQSVALTIMPGVTNPTIDFSSLVTNGVGTLPQVSVSFYSATLSMPASTTVTSNVSSWDGIVNAPTVTTIEIPSISGQTRSLSTAVEVGSLAYKLSFDKAIRILLPTQAGKRLGYTRVEEPFTEITRICAADDQATGNALPVGGDCKIDVGSDLVIWTKHFSTFATYTQADNGSGGSGGGGGGGGSLPSNSANYCSAVTYSPWQSCFGAKQFRTILTKTPSDCIPSPAQQIELSMTCSQKVDVPVLIKENNLALKSSSNTLKLPISPGVILTTTRTLDRVKYPNGVLLKTSDNRIYAVVNNKPKYISSLKELSTYKGRTLKVADAVLMPFLATSTMPQLDIKSSVPKKYPNGTLIKASNDIKLYVISDNKKIYIKTLAELKKYRGKVVVISSNDLSNY